MNFYLLISGFTGIPIPYSLRQDDGVVLILLVCFLLSAIVLAHGKKFFLQQLRDFVLHRERASIFDATVAVNIRYCMLLIVQSCALTAIVCLSCFHAATPALTDAVSPLLLLGLYAGITLVYFSLKWAVYVFLGWMFFDKKETNLWIESYSTLIYCLGFILFPFVLFLVYFTPNNPIWVGVIILIFIKILMFYKWIKFFFHHFATLFLLILYFCALEIIPCLLLYHGMVQINDILLIKI